MSTAYVNAAVYTADPDRPWASVLVEREGVIVAVGEDTQTADAGTARAT